MGDCVCAMQEHGVVCGLRCVETWWSGVRVCLGWQGSSSCHLMLQCLACWRVSSVFEYCQGVGSYRAVKDSPILPIPMLPHSTHCCKRCKPPIYLEHWVRVEATEYVAGEGGGLLLAAAMALRLFGMPGLTSPLTLTNVRCNDYGLLLQHRLSEGGLNGAVLHIACSAFKS